MSVRREIPNFLDAKVDSNGIVRWKSNGSVPPQDVLDEWSRAGFFFDNAASQKAREKDFRAFVSQYRKNKLDIPNDEQKAEMRAAFGPGVKVVNILTGRKTTT